MNPPKVTEEDYINFIIPTPREEASLDFGFRNLNPKSEFGRDALRRLRYESSEF
jgi:hypothetical protein